MQGFYLIGRITKDLELRATSGGKEVADVTLAVNNTKDDTTFITIALFGTTASATAKYCHKGDMIAVNGKIKNNNWTDNEGKKHYDYQFVANRVMFLNTKKEQSDPYEEMGNQVKEDDLPF